MTKTSSQRNMSFYERFGWAVPTAFKDPVASCWFESGDSLYDTQEAYSGTTWGDSLKHISHSIYVKLPKRGIVSGVQADTGLVFKQNWNSEVVIEFINYKQANEKQLISTTQGRLFSFLNTGDTNILYQSSENPLIPILIGELKPYMDKAVTAIQNKFKDSGKNLNLFVMGYDPTNDTCVQKFSNIESALNSTGLEVKVFDYSPEECGLENYKEFSPVVYFRCIAIETRSIEKFRDGIKKALWTKRERKKSLIEDLKEDKKRNALYFKLSNHGIFVPYIQKKYDDIRVHSFDHSPIYRYRLPIKKLDKVSPNLKKYLYSVFEECPNHLFLKDGFRASKSKFSVEVVVTHESTHELIEMAKMSRDVTVYKSRHENLQKFFLENYSCSIATELPLWIEYGEYVIDYEKIFKTKKVLTGHIDLLRYEKDGKVGVWDYKPNAYKETNAVTQVFLYTLMLSVRTGMALNQFICGYFDEIDTYHFDPNKVDLEQLKKQPV